MCSLNSFSAPVSALSISRRASNEGYPKVPENYTITWLKATTSTFTFKTLLRHYAKQAVSRLELGTPMQKSDGLVSIVSYIIAARSI